MIDETEIETIDSARFVTDDELNAGYSNVIGLIEDNRDVLVDDFINTEISELDIAKRERDITGIEEIYREINVEIKTARRPEQKERTKESFAEAAEQHAKGGKEQMLDKIKGLEQGVAETELPTVDTETDELDIF
jgi:hypothetical protein